MGVVPITNSGQLLLRLLHCSLLSTLTDLIEMADTELEVTTPEDLDKEPESNYKPPPEKTITELLEIDQDDESLRKYKETLLGQAQAGPIIVGEFSTS